MLYLIRSVVWVIHSFALALDPFHFFSLSYSAFGMFCFLAALRLFVCPSAVGCHLVHSFICSTKCGLADLVHIGVEISALNRFTTLN